MAKGKVSKKVEEESKVVGLEKLEPEQVDSGPYREIIVFQLGHELYGFDILNIEEIKIPPPLTHVPHTKDFVLGITTLRGTLFPIIHLAGFLNLPILESTLDSRVLIFTLPDEMVGFSVDKVIGVKKIPESSLGALNEAMDLEQDFYLGVISFQDSFISYLNLQKILSSPDLTNLYSERKALWGKKKK